MRGKRLSRRDVLMASLQGSTALALGAVFASPARAQAPPAEAITPQLIDAAKKEGTVILYSSMDLPVGEKLGKAFETKYPGLPSRSSAPARSGCFSGWPRKPRATSTPPT